MSQLSDQDAVIEATRRWLEKAVIGLNLCPFAGQPWHQGRVRLRVSEATRPQQLVQDLADQLLALHKADPADCETTLLIHPKLLGDFLEYNDFLDVADGVLEELALDGTIQIASFHPDYQFAGSAADDPANCTNRSPYPMLHLLREASIEAATAKLPSSEAIYERNIKTMQALGLKAWERLIRPD
ncbi:MAG: DUF1415 domain-containing protein [Xanthomonadaceae bacterium]|nr:DUF1415 domain-containing protein [Xanthomonadaceae bacterium]